MKCTIASLITEKYSESILPVLIKVEATMPRQVCEIYVTGDVYMYGYRLLKKDFSIIVYYAEFFY
jgi:hypothetical protein